MRKTCKVVVQKLSVLQGFARAKAKGVKLGRRPVKPSVEARIRELKAEGMGILKIGRAGVPELKLIMVLDGQGRPLGRKEMFSSFPRQCVLSCRCPGRAPPTRNNALTAPARPFSQLPPLTSRSFGCGLRAHGR
jgi:hypothetical protein